MSGPFRSLATSLVMWPKVEGVLRTIGPFTQCEMCEKDERLGGKEAEWTTVYYANKPTCIFHANTINELRRKARYARTAQENLERAAQKEREDEEAEESGDGDS